MDKKRIQITGEIQTDSGVLFTEKDKEMFLDSFLEFIESKDCVFIGVTK